MDEGERQREMPVKRRAPILILRAALGLLQMAAAITGLVLLLGTGVSEATIWAFVISAGLMAARQILFRSSDLNEADK